MNTNREPTAAPATSEAPTPSPTPAGWYRDPAGRPGLRFFDGRQWTDKRSMPPNPHKGARWPFLFLLIPVILGLLAWAGSGPTTYTPKDIQASVVDTCQGSAKKGLKDPGSAQFGDDWKAWEVTAAGSTPPAGMAYDPSAGDKYYSAGGEVNAKNGFGGYSGAEPYVCDAVVSTDGNIRARAHSMTDLLGPSG